MEPETVTGSSGAIQWEDSDTEEAQDSKAKKRPNTQKTALQLLDIPGNEVKTNSSKDVEKSLKSKCFTRT